MTVDATASKSGSDGNPTNTASSSSSSTGVTPPNNSYNSSQTVSVMKKNRSDVIKTIQEITKLDEFTINQAIEACQDNEGRYSMDQVLNILMDESYSQEQNQNIAERTSTGTGARGTTNHSGGSASASNNNSSNNNDERYQLHKSRGSTNVNGPHERTNDYSSSSSSNAYNNLDDDDDDDFDHYQPTSGVQKTQSPTNTIGSLSSTSTTTSNKNVSNLSELNLIREEGKPSGLRNVGNTCWFNSIIQAFFHLPYLRNLILSFQIDQFDLNKLDENSKNVVQFVNELRKLFALMLKSKRKSINPNPTLRCLKNCSKYDSELFNQEDVSEFATILVNLIEESFDILYKLQQQKELAEGTIIPILTDSISSMSLLSQSPVASTPTTQKSNSNLINMRKNRKNPIVKLLNGDILINRKNSDEDITNNLIEIFREVNIQMLNARNLHSGLELEWGETSIDKLITINKTSNNKNVPPSPQPLNRSFYQQESWIVQLPSVLFICLNRYKFVKATQSSSKIIEPFEFYPQIYLDRYMQSNRDIVKAKRKELQSLNTDLNNLQDKLKSIKNYIYHRDDKITKEPSSSSSIEFPLDIILKCVLQFSTTDYSNNDVFNLIVDPSQNQDQLTTVQTCLQSWIKQVESKISQLEMNINEIKLKIENIFDEDNLKKLKYNLHSVCIHEGNAMSGHFWTYIWNKEQQKWFKFNDTEVSESNWDDLYENAVGGNLLLNETQTPKTDKMPSAYFLIYVKDDESNLYQENIQLDSDLIKLINDDQETLQNQLQNLKLKQLLREILEKLRKSNFLINESLEKVSINNNSNKTISQSLEQNNQTCNEHAKAFNESTYEAITASFEKLVQPLTNLVTLEEALKYAFEIELNKYIETSTVILANLPDNDLRTQHILTYFSCNNVGRDIRIIALYDLFRIQTFSENNIKLKLLQTYAQIKYNEYLLASLNSTNNSSSNSSNSSSSNSINSDLFKQYEKWQADYRDYRSIIAAFISAVTYMENQKYEDAATFFCVACEYNERITVNLTLKMKGMDHEFLLLNRRRCLKLWNQSVLKRFTHSNVLTNLPPLAMNTSPTSTSDSSNSNTNTNNNNNNNQQDLTVLIETMISKFLPCFYRLSNSSSDDKAMLDEIRQDWLATLDANLPELTAYHDFMAKLFEDPFVNHFHSLNVNKTNLLNRYKDIVQTLKKNRIR